MMSMNCRDLLAKGDLKDTVRDFAKKLGLEHKLDEAHQLLRQQWQTSTSQLVSDARAIALRRLEEVAAEFAKGG